RAGRTRVCPRDQAGREGLQRVGAAGSGRRVVPLHLLTTLPTWQQARPRPRGRVRARSVQLALPGLEGRLARWELAGAVPVQPGRGATLGVLLVGRHALVVKFEDVGEDREAGLHLRRRVLQLVPVVDPLQHRMTHRAVGYLAGEPTDRSGRTRT